MQISAIFAIIFYESCERFIEFNEKIHLDSFRATSYRLEGGIMSNEMKIIANESDFILKVQSELEFDSLYQLIVEREPLRRELMREDFLNELGKDLHRWYSVSEAGKVIGGDKKIPPSSLNYYIENLKEYIIPGDAPSNKYVRLNYLSLLKLKMVLLLKDEFRLNGLKAEVGITGNPKNVVNQTSNDSNLPSTDFDNDLEERLQKLEVMNEMLLNLLVEKGEDDRPQLKKALQSLLNSENRLLEGESSLASQLEEQQLLIENLTKENEKLKERIDKTEEAAQKFSEKVEQDETELSRILESEKQINHLAENLRARQQAEAEWEKQGLMKRITGNRSEFVTRRIEEILGTKQ